MKRAVAILIGLSLLLAGCGTNVKLSGESASDLMNDIFSYLKDEEFGILSGWVDEGDDKPVFHYELREEGLDYEALKKQIHREYGRDFTLEFTLVAFPTEPMITGIVRQIKGEEILIVADTSDWTSADGNPYYNALWVRTNKNTEFVDYDGNQLSFEDISTGMAVDSYDRGGVLESYPGQAGSEKIVVNKVNGIKHIKEIATEAEYKDKYLEQDISEGLLMLTWLEFDEMDLDDSGQYQLRIYVDYGYEHYAYDGLISTPVLYELKCFFFIEGSNLETEVGYTLDHIMMKPGDQPVLEDSDNDGLMEVVLTVWINGELREESFEIQENGSIEGMERVVF